MKKVILTILPLVLLMGCSHQENPPEEELYRHYAVQEDLKVAQVNGFKLCDTVRVDVVMVQAEDEEAWLRLTEEFDIRGQEGTVSWLGNIEDPSLRVQWTGEPVMRVIASNNRHAIGFYRIDKEAQYDALIDYQLEKTANKN